MLFRLCFWFLFTLFCFRLWCMNILNVICLILIIVSMITLIIVLFCIVFDYSLHYCFDKYWIVLLMMILIFEVSSWLLYDIDYLDLSAIIPEQKLDFQRWRLCMKKSTLSNRFAIPFVFNKNICLGFSMITHVRTVHGCLSYSLSIIFSLCSLWFKSMLSQTWWGWVGGGVCVCAGVRAGWGWGVGGGGVMGRWPPAGGGVGVVQGIRFWRPDSV